jgi:hypothetical protein
VGNFSRDRPNRSHAELPTAGRWSGADSTKHYKIARGEAMECAASLDVMKLRKLVAPARYDDGIRLLEGVVGMLTKMV